MKRQYHGDFENLSFPKRGSEILDRVRSMVTERLAKIEERKERIAKSAKEMKLDTSLDVLLKLDELGTGSYSSNQAGGITVGGAAELRGEIVALKSQEQEVERLQAIERNLPPSETFKLSFAEMDFFGF